MTDIELKMLKDNLWHSADMLRAGAHLAAQKLQEQIERNIKELFG